MKVEVEVKELSETAIFFHSEVATFEGGDIVMNIGNGTIVIQFKEGHEYHGRYAFSVQAMMDGLVENLKKGKN